MLAAQHAPSGHLGDGAGIDVADVGSHAGRAHDIVQGQMADQGRDLRESNRSPTVSAVSAAVAHHVRCCEELAANCLCSDPSIMGCRDC